MPIYEITQLPVQVSDARARELVAAFKFTLLAPIEIGGEGISITIEEDLSPAQMTTVQNLIREAVLASIGTITKRV